MNIYDLKREYDNMPIPDELDNIVEAAVTRAENMEAGKGMKRSTKRKFRGLRVAAIVCAAASVFCIIMLNVNKSFAMAVKKVPIIGHLAAVVTWVDYEDENENRVINIKLPKIESSSRDDLENRINNEIRVKINTVVKEAEERAEEYRQAFLATGGSEADWHPLEIYVDYEVKCNENNILSFVITKAESYASVYAEKYYYNIDMETGRELKLSDMLGPDYIEISNEIIKKSIEERMSTDENAMFFGYGEDDSFANMKFETITDETKFYINENEQAVVVFDKYEIAPGYMGFVEFVIAR